MTQEPRWTRAVFWAAIAAGVAPLLSARYLPFTDLPEHVAAMSTMSRWLGADGAEQATYAITFWRSQYLLYHAAGALLTRVLGDAVLANRLLLVGLALAQPLSVRAALRALGRDERLALLAAMPFLSRPLFVGFLPYMASLPLYFLGIALVVRRAEGGPGTRRTTLLLGLLSVALFYTHLSTLLVFVVSAFALEVVLGARSTLQPSSPDGAPWSLARWARGRARGLAWLAPVALIAAGWSVASRITLRGESLTDRGEIGKMDLSRSLHALPLWTFDVFRSHVDEICGGVWWTALGVLAVLGVRSEARAFAAPPRAVSARQVPLAVRLLGRLDAAYVPLLCVLAIYFVTPFRIGAGGMLNVRLAPLVALTATLTIPRSRGVLRDVLWCGVALATVVHALNAAREIRALAREQGMTDFDEILAAMRPGSRVVTLAFAGRATRTYYDPYPFAGSYHRARGGGVASYSFSDLPHWPVQYRSDARPPPKPVPLWIYAPCAYRHGSDGPYYDYVLVHGGVDPFAGEPAGPVFRERHRIPGFVLYEKVPGEAWTGEGGVDGPCARPVGRP
ncbi:MAG TPA: hypothetical protein VLT33_33540 [Labilithrix sp.]|nr:hypothetical protein [Labilithrix sp.]